MLDPVRGFSHRREDPLNANNKSGFTLLEVIIVIIIIAILASVAMPKISAALYFAKAKEALGVIPPMRTALDACAMLGGNDYTDCPANAAALGIPFSGKYFGEPTVTNRGANAYTITVPGSGTLGSIIFTHGNGAITGTGNFSTFNTGGY